MAKRPLRSLLTIFQTGLGVWIVAIILSLNLQATGTLDLVNRSLGDSLAKVSVSQREESPDGSMIMTGSISNLRTSDLETLETSEYIESAYIFQNQWERNILVDGLAYRVQNPAEVSSSYAQAMDLELVEGQFFTKADQEQRSKVVLVSEPIAHQLFPNQSALGRLIQLGEYGESLVAYEVIGVYKPQSQLLEFFVSQANLIFPLGAAQPAWMNEGDEGLYQEIFIRAKSGQVYEAVADTQVLLAHRSRDEMEIRGEYFRDSTVFFSEQVQTMTLFLGAFAFISILISAIGILSIMLVSVVERTREIGLRKALGASKGVIVRQILNESFVFSTCGALLGLLVAYFTAEQLIGLLIQEITYPKLTNVGGLHPLAALLSLGVAVAMGQIFGFYPAWQAAKMAPVDAFRDA
jgi:putative ABC transport system permease protein